MKKVLLVFLLSCICSSAFAGTTSTRNKLSYFFGDYALHTITTTPAQAFQPVYSWRTHTRFDGAPGLYGHTAEIIGYTNANGILNIVVPQLPSDLNLCGSYNGERVAVGSPSNPKSNTLNFTVQAISRDVDFAPMPPDFCFQ